MDISLDDYIRQNFHQLGLAASKEKTRGLKNKEKNRVRSGHVGKLRKSKWNAKTFVDLKALWSEEDSDTSGRTAAKTKWGRKNLRPSNSLPDRDIPDLRLKLINKTWGKLHSCVDTYNETTNGQTSLFRDSEPLTQQMFKRHVSLYDDGVEQNCFRVELPSPHSSELMDVDGDEFHMQNLTDDDEEVDRCGHLESETEFVIEIRNLNNTVAEEDIEELFGVVGRILRVVKKSAGSAQVTFGRLQEALCAIQLYHNRLLDGKPMDITLRGAYGQYQDPRSDTLNALRSCDYICPWKSNLLPHPTEEAVRAALFKKAQQDSCMFTVVLPKLKD